MAVSTRSSELRVGLQIALDIAVDVLAFAGEFEQRIQIGGQRGDALRRCRWLSSRRLRSCMIFWLFLGLAPEVRRGDLFF